MANGRKFVVNLENMNEKKWVRVGSKRKAGLKGRTRGKDNNNGNKMQCQGENKKGEEFLKPSVFVAVNPFSILEDESQQPNKVNLFNQEVEGHVVGQEDDMLVHEHSNEAYEQNIDNSGLIREVLNESSILVEETITEMEQRVNPSNTQVVSS